MTITVLDVNDNHPEFTATQYNGTIMEGSLPSVAVTIVCYGIIPAYYLLYHICFRIHQ